MNYVTSYTALLACLAGWLPLQAGIFQRGRPAYVAKDGMSESVSWLNSVLKGKVSKICQRMKI